MTRPVTALTGLWLVLSVAGCGAPPERTDEAADAPPGVTVATQSEPGARTIEIPTEPPLEGRDPATYTYDQRVDNIVFLLDAFWSNALPERFDTEYTPPQAVVAYDTEESDPGCAGESQGAGNAYYCEPDDLIAWDDAGLIEPLDTELGEDAITFVLAHEWAHLAQQRLGLINEYPLTVEKELAADCLAGDFFGALADEVGMTDDEFNSITAGIETFGDQDGIPWTDPSAHGTPLERAQALDVGFFDGAEACLEEFAPGFSG